MMADFCIRGFCPCIYFLLLLSCVSLTIQLNREECKYVTHNYTQMPVLYQIDGSDVTIIAKVFALQTANGSCTINGTQLITSYDFPVDRVVTAIFAFACNSPLHIELTDVDALRDMFYNVVAYFQVKGCSFDMETLHMFSDAFDMRVVTLMDTPVDGLSNCSVASCKRGLLKSAVALTIDNTPESVKQDVLEIMSGPESFPEMKELTFIHLDWDELPYGIIHTFPFLESLEIPNNNFTKPPANFPWNEELSYLPRNFSRSLYFQSQYSLSLNIDIPPNVYRRVYDLDNNNIRNLSDFEFHGTLHMISLNNNSLQDIGEKCFRQVFYLQNICLRNNKLTSLPARLFSGLTSLRHLDMYNNRIEDLPDGIFDDSPNLVYINLASNRLSVIRKGLFAKLLNLETLYLDRNNLAVITEASFPLQSIVLKTIGLSNNPLRHIPKITFYIRSLRRIDLQNTSITLTNFSGQLEDLDYNLMIESIVHSVSDTKDDLFLRPNHIREINLSENQIQGIGLSGNLSERCKVKLILLLIHFHFNLHNNPLMCDCGILPLIDVIHQYAQNATITPNDYFFREWECATPQELHGRTLLEVKKEETYCKANVSLCPARCRCYERTYSRIIIVDCRNTDMMSLPVYLPEGVLDLWFQVNNITKIETRNYFSRVRTLLLTSNQISHIDRDAVLQFNFIENLHLSSNNLIGLPEEIQNLNLAELSITDNPFSCDCHSLWMRSWVERNKDVVLHPSTVTCNTQIGTAKPLIKVPSTQFVCKHVFDARKHVTIPATVSSIAIIIVISLVALVCIYRLEVKVFLYIYTGIRPFDKTVRLAKKSIDLVVVHSPSTQAWVTENVLPLSQRIRGGRHEFHIFDICTDCVAGFSLQDNITCLVEQTRKVLIVLSKDFLRDAKLQMAWTEIKRRIPDNGTGFIQFVVDGVLASDVPDSEMACVMKHTRCLQVKERIITKKLIYYMYMPENRASDETREKPMLQSLLENRNRNSVSSVYISDISLFLNYSEDILSFIIHDMCPKLQRLGYSLCIPDKDFTLGAAKEENILQAVSGSSHTLFIVSENTFVDEWSLYTFRAAVQKSLRDKYNHLVVVLMRDINMESVQDKELRHYLKSHVTLSVADENFFKKLRLSFRQVGCIVPQFNGIVHYGIDHDITLNDIAFNV